MNVPGSNLLNIALRVIAAQAITYKAYASRVTQANGMLVTTYASPVTVRGSLQPVPRTLMELLGLDMQRTYVNIYLPQAVVDIGRDVTSDQFQYAGITYQGISATPWAALDGWSAILCVQVPNA